jgi:pimeloyl-ACP methyl ester carboxylesterase
VDTGALVELLRGLAEAETRVLLQTYEAVSGDPARGLLGSISAPTLIVAGDRDRFVPASLRQEMLERLPDARLEVFKDATHFLPLEHPQALAELIMSFAED